MDTDGFGLQDHDFDPDVCRVCQSEGSTSRPLYHPCMCTGTIKYIHQECLIRWLQYSDRTNCELCNHKFRFSPIYSPNTPRFLPPFILLRGLARSCFRSFVTVLQRILVVLAWFIVVPLAACRIYRCLLTGSMSSLLALPLDMLSTRNLIQDCIQGTSFLLIGLAAVLGYSSLHERLLQAGGPDWLVWETTNEPNNNAGQPQQPARQHQAGAVPDLLANMFAPALPVNGNQQQPPRNGGGLELQPQRVDWRFADDEEADNEQQPAAANNNEDRRQGRRGANLDPGGFGDDEQFNLMHLFGLDGTFAFLEHVLWLIALNTLFIVVFVFCPYHMGQLTLVTLNIESWVETTRMEGFCTGLVGYILVAFILVTANLLLTHLRMPRASYWAGLGYIYVKVTLMVIFELGICPILCGFWIDACTLFLFNATIFDRVNLFNQAPLVVSFIHWAVGLFFIFYLTSSLLVARSVVRPGLLDFIRHLINLDQKPVHDMIVQPLHIYIQRIIATYSLWGIFIVLMLWLPVEIIRRTLPNVFPFQISEAYESPIEYSVEILLVQIVLPFLVDNPGKTFLKQIIRSWLIAISYLLGLRSYLLGDESIKPGEPVVHEDGSIKPFVPKRRPGSSSTQQQQQQQQAAASTNGAGEQQSNVLVSVDNEEDGQSSSTADDYHHDNNDDAAAGLDNDVGDEFGNAGLGDNDTSQQRRAYVVYKRPETYFYPRLAFLLLVSLVSLILASALFIVAPVSVGRLVFRVFSPPSIPKHDAVAVIAGSFVLGLFIRLITSLPPLLTRVWPLLLTVLAQSRDELLGWLNLILTFLRPSWLVACGSRSWWLMTKWTRRRRPARASSSSSTLLAIRGGPANSTVTPVVDFIRLTRIIASRVGQLIGLVALAHLLLVILPTGFGLLINLTLIAPIRVPPNKTIYFGFWDNWIIGFMHLKFLLLLATIGPEWWLQRRLTAIRDELVAKRIDARPSFILWQAQPLLIAITLGLCLPYVCARQFIDQLQSHSSDLPVPLHHVYPVFFTIFLLITSIACAGIRLCQLYRSIKDEEYVVGLRLINFQARRSSSASTNTHHQDGEYEFSQLRALTATATLD